MNANPHTTGDPDADETRETAHTESEDARAALRPGAGHSGDDVTDNPALPPSHAPGNEPASEDIVTPEAPREKFPAAVDPAEHDDKELGTEGATPEEKMLETTAPAELPGATVPGEPRDAGDAPAEPPAPPPAVATVSGKTTPRQFKVKTILPVKRTQFLATTHEGRRHVLGVQKVWADRKGGFAQLAVLGEIPQTPFPLDSHISYATPSEIKAALRLDVPPENALDIGTIMNSPLTATIDVKKLGRLFITGKSGSGKSYTVGVLIEALMKKGIPVIVLDRHGEYSSLKIVEPENVPPGDPFFDVADYTTVFAQNIIEFADPEMNPGADLGMDYLLASAAPDLVSQNQCTIINLRGIDIPIQENIAETILARLYRASTRQEIPPFFLFIDEAHLFAGKKKKDIVATIQLLAQEGRKFGANLVVITQKPQALDTTVRAQAGTWIIHKLTDVNDVRITINSSEGLTSHDDDDIQILAPGEAIVTGDVALTAPLRVKIRKRYTVHGGAGYNVLDYVEAGHKLHKAEVVERLRARLTEPELDASKEVIEGARKSRTELQSRVDALRKENLELKQHVEVLEARVLELESAVPPEKPTPAPAPAPTPAPSPAPDPDAGQVSEQDATTKKGEPSKKPDSPVKPAGPPPPVPMPKNAPEPPAPEANGSQPPAPGGPVPEKDLPAETHACAGCGQEFLASNLYKCKRCGAVVCRQCAKVFVNLAGKKGGVYRCVNCT